MTHHGEALRRITGDDQLVAALSTDPDAAPLDARSRVLVDVALTLTRRPAAIGPHDVERLRSVGLGDRGIHDLVAVAAYFAFVNRIALGLGVELES